jgi:hypothetical protein
MAVNFFTTGKMSNKTGNAIIQENAQLLSQANSKPACSPCACRVLNSETKPLIKTDKMKGITHFAAAAGNFCNLNGMVIITPIFLNFVIELWQS